METWLLIGLSVMFILCLIVNESWYKHSMKINADWAEYCKMITEEHYNTIDTLAAENQALKRKLQEDNNELS